MRVPTPSPPLATSGGIGLSDSEKAEALAENLEAQFQPVTDFLVQAVIETVAVALRAYFLSPTSEPQLTTPDDVHEAIKGLEVSKTPGPYGIPNRTLKHLPKASGFPPDPDLQCGSPHPFPSSNVETRLSDLCP
jgi:hypothetical protein